MKTRLASLLMLSALILSAADVTGKWTGTLAPAGGEDGSPALLELKQTGTEITGTVGPDESQRHTISKGTIDGNKVAVEVAAEGRSIKMNLVLDGDHLKGEIVMSSGGQSRTAKLDVTRAK